MRRLVFGGDNGCPPIRYALADAGVDGEVGEEGGGRGPVPVHYTRRDAHGIAGAQQAGGPCSWWQPAPAVTTSSWPRRCGCPVVAGAGLEGDLAHRTIGGVDRYHHRYPGFAARKVIGRSLVGNRNSQVFCSFARKMGLLKVRIHTRTTRTPGPFFNQKRVSGGFVAF